MKPSYITIGEIISRVRKQLKASTKDALVTDRFLYSVIRKHAAWLMRREDSKNNLLTMSHERVILNHVNLIDVDVMESGCTGMKSGMTIKRTEDPLPGVFMGYYGPLINTVTSIDGSIRLQKTTFTEYQNIIKSKSHKYNKTKYYWYKDNYLYFPNIDWEMVNIEGLFDGIVDKTLPAQQHLFPVPDYLHGEIEAHVLKDDLLIMYQIPVDTANDNQHTLR